MIVNPYSNHIYFRCSTKGDEDYRPLFENFVYDLLSTANKPDWPAAELLLSLLGRLLVQQFTNKQIEMSLRVASLDYLGIVAARLRKDAVTSKLNEASVDDIIQHVSSSDRCNVFLYCLFFLLTCALIVPIPSP